MKTDEIKPETESLSYIRTVCGVGLLGFGLFVGLKLITSIAAVINGEQTLKFVENWLALPKEALLISIEGRPVQLPPIMFQFGAYLVVVFLLGICAGLAKTFVTSGASLLQDDVRILAQKFVKHIRGR